MAKLTLKELRQKRRAGEKLGPKQLARLQNARANKPAPKPAPKANKAQGALATGPKPTNKKPKLTIAELQQKQAAGGKLGPKQMARLERAEARNQPAGNINPKTNKPYKFTLEELQAKQAAGQDLRPKQIKRLQEAGLYQEPSGEPAPIQELPPEQMFERVGGQTAAGIESLMGQIQGAGAFQPGNYQDMMNQAYQNVMNQFEMTQGPQFAREQADFQQMAAERGLDPNSEAYKTMQQQLNQRQDLARQGAMAQAQQQAQAVQAQGFQQAAQQYQMPGQMLGAYSPFYSQFGAQQESLRQAQLAREEMANRLEQQRISAGATLGAAQAGNFGRLSSQQQIEQANLNRAQDFMLAQMRYGPQAQQPLPPSPSAGNQFAAGLAQGIGAGIGNALS